MGRVREEPAKRWTALAWLPSLLCRRLGRQVCCQSKRLLHVTLIICRRYVVSIRQSKPLTKFEKMWNSPCIAIEDPFELSHNLGAGISRKSKKLHFWFQESIFRFSEPLHQESIHQRTTSFRNPADLESSRLSNGPGGPSDKPLKRMQKHPGRPQDYFFDPDLLTDGAPPNDRGCRACGKVSMHYFWSPNSLDLWILRLWIGFL